MKSNSNEIRSPRNGAKLGDKVMLGKEPVVLIKQGGKKDTMSIPEIVEELYGRGTKCIIILCSVPMVMNVSFTKKTEPKFRISERRKR